VYKLIKLENFAYNGQTDRRGKFNQVITFRKRTGGCAISKLP